MRKFCFIEHRRFLEKDHRFKINQSLFNGRIELRNAPIPLSMLDLFKQVECLDVTFGKPLEIPNTSKRDQGNNVEVVGHNNGEREVYFLTFLIGRLICCTIVWMSCILRRMFLTMYCILCLMILQNKKIILKPERISKKWV